MLTHWLRIFRGARLSDARQTQQQTAPIDASDPASLGIVCSIQSLMRLRYEAGQSRLPSARRASRQQTGSHRSNFRGRGMEFAEVRPYQPGDDVRTIDWRVTARRQKPHTKLFHEERERPVYIICDQSQSQFFGSQRRFKSVLAGEIAGFIAWCALDQGDRVGGIVFSDAGHHEIRAERKRKTVMQFLQLVSDFSQRLLHPSNHSGVSVDLNKTLQEARRVIKPGSLVVIVSDFHDLDEDSGKLLSYLAKHNDLQALMVYDPLERQLPPPGRYPVQLGADIRQFDSSNTSLQAAYQKAVNERLVFIRDTMRSFRIPLGEFSTIDDRSVIWKKLSIMGGSYR